jgi:putative OPT family oligopeptide transporter
MGVLFVIPLRRYFVRDMHGLLPYPEATAITEVLVTGERGGSQARLLLEATAIAGVYDFFVTTFSVWKEYLNFQFVPLMRMLNERARIVCSFDAISFILGLGYVIGLRSSMILCAGGMLSNFVMVPLIWYVGNHFDSAVYPAAIPISKMTAVMIYRSYVRFIGVGAIATGGIFGILKSLRIVASSFGIALRVFRHTEAVAAPERTDRDIPMLAIVLGVLASAIGVAVFLGYLPASWTAVAIGMLLTLVFSFFFTSVAANAIATTARNPVSGMTMLTIIISSVVLLQFGVSGTTGMFFVMAIAGMVCTALSVSGQAITDFKTGYWIGSTPAAQEKIKFLGVIAAAIAASLTIVMLARGFQFAEAAVGDLRPVLPSPQASIMKALVEGLMSHQPVAYALFGVGAVIAVILEMLGLPSLLFALGMYLPLELNTPALVGGVLSHFVNKRAARTGGDAGRSVRERGVIIASGLMAGGALGGVLGAALRLLPKYREDLIRTPFFANEPVSQLVSAALFLGLCCYMWFGAMRREKVS